MKYTLDTSSKEQHYLVITMEVKTPLDETLLQLPAWRPGRYELGNFAKNIQKFEVFNERNELLGFDKISKDCWKVTTQYAETIRVKYNYYSIDFNAGSTYLSEEVLYVNPVNCFVYVPDEIDKSCTVEIPVGENEKIACGVPFEKGEIQTENFHELADTPFLVSSKLQVQDYESEGVKVSVWFYGECKPAWKKVIEDFKKFTDYQIQQFGGFPTSHYHFINIIHPHKAYHGVEHTTSTIIVLGPSYEVMTERYVDLLGVSSHELYHAWNIKSIRPAEMNPYDYSKENYSKLGYVAEGVTTYMGDLMLYESGVFNKKEYANELNQYLRRHYTNGGRLAKSVADSSFDTWLDGYEVGAPDRKSSIYMEGALISFMIDTKIRQESSNRFSLHDVMKELYENFGKKSIGYSEVDYKSIIEQFSGISFDEFFQNYIWGTKDFTEELSKCLALREFELIKKPSKIASERFGIILRPDETSKALVLHVSPNSSGWNAGITREDVILSVNGFLLKKNLNEWLAYFENSEIELEVAKGNKTRKVRLAAPNQHQFWEYTVNV